MRPFIPIALLAGLVLLTITTAMAAPSPPPAASPMPVVVITNADKLNGYIAAADFLSHFTAMYSSASQLFAPSHDDDAVDLDLDLDQQHYLRKSPFFANKEEEKTTGHPHPPAFAVHCTVDDATTTFAQRVADLGCIVHAVPTQSSEEQWHAAFTAATSSASDAPLFLVYVPSMHAGIAGDASAALAAAAKMPTFTHAVVWSRVGADSAGSQEMHDLEAFGWYAALEKAAVASLAAESGRMTVLRLAFALERFLDLAADIEDMAALRFNLGDKGVLFPITLHDAVWASRNVLVYASEKSLDEHRIKSVMHLTTQQPHTGQSLAQAATDGLKRAGVLTRPIRYEPLSRDQAEQLFMSQENVTPDLVTVLADVFECATRPGAACQQVAPIEEVKALMGGGDRAMRDPAWVFERYAEYFTPGGLL
ncbi:hypothetical protein BC828DRAFT_382720 [Blastocladiella britannica]|nr:hypothetical protein BC828DRAFT_382720 [Blastocladiella britannica]